MAHVVKSAKQGWISPTTPLGRLSIRLLVAFAGCLGLFIALVASGQRGGDSILDNLWLLGSMGAAALSVIGAGVAGALAILRQGDRSASVMFAVVMGSLSLFYFVAELVIPH